MTNKNKSTVIALTRATEKLLLNTYIKEAEVNKLDATDFIREFKSFNPKIIKYIKDLDLKNVSTSDVTITAEDFVIFHTNATVEENNKYCNYNMFVVYVSMYIYVNNDIQANIGEIEEVYDMILEIITNK